MERSYQREVIECLLKVRNVRNYYCYPKTGGCALQIKVANYQTNIFILNFV